MAEFDILTKNFTVFGHDISSALRYPFFADCLHTDNYLHYSWLNFRCLFTPNGWQYQYQPADAIFVQEGNSDREKEQILPVVNWLVSQNCSAGVVTLSPIRRRQRLWISLKECVRERSCMCGLERSLDSLNNVAVLLMKKFDLSPIFEDWLKMQVAQALCRHKRAILMLERAGPKPKAVVVNSEYHPVSRAILTAARKLGVSTILVQHGFLGQEWLHWPVSSDKVCVWGAVDRRWYIDRGLPMDRVTVTGSQRAFSIDAQYRADIRRVYGVQKNERVVVFFSPNLGRDYHARAVDFLRAVKANLSSPAKLLVRLHPSDSSPKSTDQYRDFGIISPSVPIRQAFAVADLVLHDYSTMAFAEYAGLETFCLSIDPPYPEYYSGLLGGQTLIKSVKHLCEIIRDISPGYDLTTKPTVTMASGGDEALQRLGQVILDAVHVTE